MLDCTMVCNEEGDEDVDAVGGDDGAVVGDADASLVYTLSSSNVMAMAYCLEAKNLNVSGDSATEVMLLPFWNQPMKLMLPLPWVSTEWITLPEAVVTVILLAFECNWTLKFRTRKENPLTGGEKVNTSEPNVAAATEEDWGGDSKNRNTPFNLHTYKSQRLPRAAYARCKRIDAGNRGRVLVCCKRTVSWSMRKGVHV